MSLKARSMIVKAKERWELTHDGSDPQMRKYIDIATAEVFSERLASILDVCL